MKIILYLSLALVVAAALVIAFRKILQPQTFSSFADYPVYDGEDLGLSYSPKESVFKIWSPTAAEARIIFYREGAGGEPLATYNMKKIKNGAWEIKLKGDLLGQYYTCQVKINGKWLEETTDPYARAVGVNGKRAMVIDLATTNPEGWEQDKRPAQGDFTDNIIYELHIRDLSIHPESGIKNKGKFLGLAETGTTGPGGVATGLDHIKELGVTHIHLLPFYDYLSIDESRLEENRYNWGYDPQNYNVPEGGYSTNPNDGAVRIREVKEMVKTLHENGLRVVMDVVYNHTGATENSNFNQLVPGYYYRQKEDGSFSDAAACGNETASERPMMRKFMLESVVYWVKEYHIDGFRFDLMGIHDIETMNLISETLHKIDPTILLYGEGWTAGQSPLPDSLRALKANTHQLDRIAAFSDDIRDGIKGHVFTPTEKGFASGKPGLEESIKFGVVASTLHPQLDYEAVNYSKAPWAAEPYQTITYVSCHDNHTLWDRLSVSVSHATEAERIKMHKLSGAVVLCSQGISFLHAGVEMLRSKNGVENSFKSPDEVNRLDWTRKNQYPEVFRYFQDLIRMRKAHPAFRMPEAEMIRTHLRFLEDTSPNIVGFTINGHANGDSWEKILVLFNGNRTVKHVEIPPGNWKVALNEEGYDENGFGQVAKSVKLPASSAMVLVGNE